jgi:PPM family protein phosphatase
MMNLQDKITIMGLTDAGMVREKNEDTIGFDSALGLVVLADGMGGHRGGDIASSMTVDTIIDVLQQKLPDIESGEVDDASGYSMESICIQDAVITANDIVYKTAEANPEHKGMGTTIVVLQFYNNSFSLAHIGDSRCYRLRNDEFEQITKDHSLLQELIDRGFYTPEEAKNSMNKNLVTRALGIDPVVVPDIQEDIVLKNDIYLLCSDGLTDLVEDPDIYYTIKEFSDNLEEAAKQLITKANQKGGKDNISVMLCRIDDDFSTRQGWFKKLVAWFD